MTLLVAKLLKPRLEALGARVSLVREKPEPVTPLRPDSLLRIAKDSNEPADSPAALQKLAERLFYRTAEIRARAKLVNETLKPDLVLCLHFNADPWGDPNQPTSSTAPTSTCCSTAPTPMRRSPSPTSVSPCWRNCSAAPTRKRRSSAPPWRTPSRNGPACRRSSIRPDCLNALPVNGHPYLWARNLLANRLYDCPVIFMEPYVMNSTIDHPRLQAGDYDGLREINGKPQPIDLPRIRRRPHRRPRPPLRGKTRGVGSAWAFHAATDIPIPWGTARMPVAVDPLIRSWD